MDWIDGAGWATLAMLLTASSLLPWYVAWLLPLVGLCTDRRLWRSLILTGMDAADHDDRIHPARRTASDSDAQLVGG